MRKIMIVLMSLATLSLSVAAQTQNGNRKVNFGGGIELGVPLGEFQENFSKKTFGYNANLSVPMNNRSPLEFGADYRFHLMGSDRDDVSVTELIDNGNGEIKNVEHAGEMSVNSRMHALHGQMRLKPFNGAVAPYIDGLAGLRYHTAHSKLKVDDGDFQISERSLVGPQSKFNFSYGAAVGTTVRLTKGLNVDLKWSYLWGKNAQYMDPETLSVDGATQTVNYDLKESSTDMMVFTVGLRF